MTKMEVALEINPSPPLLVNTPEAARRLSVSRSFLEKKRFFGDADGPPYIKIGRAIRYRLVDLEAWAAAHRTGGAE
ncbi:helix-turn-helix transcriptional regulator [Devosia elaeis]|jgi:hypothetical protein|uniref:helix-turn-helix transcriptional regulator n=1 Tax=Devosia elaeis TaxID=1770058 RepID=UPI000D694C03|nr:helix-turn-helix domain-containing protein [Devosia elaeis]